MNVKRVGMNAAGRPVEDQVTGNVRFWVGVPCEPDAAAAKNSLGEDEKEGGGEESRAKVAISRLIWKVWPI